MSPKQIQALRAKLGISQRELAKVIGCSVYTIQYYEQGRRNPCELFEERLERLADKAKRMEERK